MLNALTFLFSDRPNHQTQDVMKDRRTIPQGPSAHNTRGEQPKREHGLACRFLGSLSLLLVLLANAPRLCAQQAHPNAGPDGITSTTEQLAAAENEPSEPIPWDGIGAKATADYSGDAIGVRATPEGAMLHTGFQKLSGTVTREGLTLNSTDKAGGALKLTASAFGREGNAVLLPAFGTVAVSEKFVSFVRPGLTEEYSVSVDGVRQDFILADRPAGSGELYLELTLHGATAEARADGATLTLNASGRKLVYNRLHVTDATGNELAARLEVSGTDLLAIQVEDANATYPLRIDPTFSDANWVSMNPGIPGASNTVNACVSDGSGNLYIGGGFSLVGNVLANHIAKWDGSSWSALGTGVGSTVYALAVNGTDLYVGGSFTTAGAVSANRIAKWDGSSWSALGTGMNNTVNALALSGTDVYAGGAFATAGGVLANRIAKWDGNSWSALGTGMNNTVRALAVSGADLYAGGGFTTAGAANTNYIAKWDGSSWSALDVGVTSSVYAVVVNGTDLYVGGDFIMAGGVSANYIAKWDGSSWSALGSMMDGSVRSLAVSGTNLYAGGYFTTAGGVSARIAKWDGSGWSALGTGVNNVVSALAVSATGIYAGGNFTTVGGVVANRIAKWDGISWSALGTGMNSDVTALAVSGTDLYAGGEFAMAGGVANTSFLAKWDGNSWSALDTGMDGAVLALAVNGTDLYAGGGFSTAGGVSANRIAKWDGISWSALGTGVEGWVRGLAVNGTDLYAGGDFIMAGGVSADRIAKWDGSSWSALGTGMDGSVRSLAVSGTDLYAGGYFTTAGGVANTHGIAKWDGSSWSALGTGMNSWVRGLAVSGPDLYAGGFFNQAGGVSAYRIAKWDGSSWSALGTGMNNSVYTLAVNGTDLYAGGPFTTAGTTVSPFIVRGIIGPDTDSDGIVDVLDNCPTTANTSQADSDADDLGDACDACLLAVDGIANFDENSCACVLGYFATITDIGGNDVITACTICPAGSFCADGLVAQECPAGRFQDQEGQTACVPCAAGSAQPATGQIACTLCAANTYNPIEGQTNCTACPSGELSGVGATECVPFIRIAARVFLEGPYDSATGMMADSLRGLGSFPLTDPYPGLGYVHTGAGNDGTVDPSVLAVTGNDAIVDRVLLELRDAATPANIVASRSVLLQRDGDVVELDGSSPLTVLLPPGNYHVAVRHRNHLGTMTASAVALSETATVVDLTTSATTVYGTDARVSITGVFPAEALWAGDVTFDHTVIYTGTANDRDVILLAIGGVVPTNSVSGYRSEDVNLDGIVRYTGTGNDRDIILQNIGGVVPTNTRTEQLP